MLTSIRVIIFALLGHAIFTPYSSIGASTTSGAFSSVGSGFQDASSDYDRYYDYSSSIPLHSSWYGFGASGYYHQHQYSSSTTSGAFSSIGAYYDYYDYSYRTSPSWILNLEFCMNNYVECMYKNELFD